MTKRKSNRYIPNEITLLYQYTNKEFMITEYMSVVDTHTRLQTNYTRPVQNDKIGSLRNSQNCCDIIEMFVRRKRNQTPETCLET